MNHFFWIAYLVLLYLASGIIAYRIVEFLWSIKRLPGDKERERTSYWIVDDHLVIIQRARDDEPFWYHIDRKGYHIRAYFSVEKVTHPESSKQFVSIILANWIVAIELIQ